MINLVMQKSNLAWDGDKPFRKNLKCGKKEPKYNHIEVYIKMLTEQVQEIFFACLHLYNLDITHFVR